ncbi:hypothetical protein J1614_006567 [Plenodomus biglobosus]|nr:hypothetical protein J1614_006567 [Plenodomus biglobosus]
MCQNDWPVCPKCKSNFFEPYTPRKGKLGLPTLVQCDSVHDPNHSKIIKQGGKHLGPELCVVCLTPDWDPEVFFKTGWLGKRKENQSLGKTDETQGNVGQGEQQQGNPEPGASGEVEKK